MILFNLKLQTFSYFWRPNIFLTMALIFEYHVHNNLDLLRQFCDYFINIAIFSNIDAFRLFPRTLVFDGLCNFFTSQMSVWNVRSSCNVFNFYTTIVANKIVYGILVHSICWRLKAARWVVHFFIHPSSFEYLIPFR